MAKPTDVRIERADGTVLHCELVHEGVDDEGVDHWLIANAQWRPSDQIKIGVLPARTSIGFTCPDDLIGQAQQEGINIHDDDT